MLQQNLSLFTVFKSIKSCTVTLQNNSIIGLCFVNILPRVFDLFHFCDLYQVDLTASNHPERYFSNTLYYMYSSVDNQISFSQSAQRKGTAQTASIVNFCALVTERECYEMFGVFFENHSDLRKLLLDYGTCYNPLLKEFPLTGYVQIAYTQDKCIKFKPIEMAQSLRRFEYILAWYTYL